MAENEATFEEEKTTVRCSELLWPEAGGTVLFQRFEMRKTIAKRSFWRSYEVLDSKHGRVSILHVVLAGAPDYERRLRDARCWASLNLPGIPPISDLSTVADGFYLVAEKGEGVPLSTWMAEPRPPIEATLTAFRELARTLATCHRAGLVWGSIEPKHVIIDGLGHPRLTNAPESIMADRPLPPQERSLSFEVLQRAYTERGVPGTPYCAPELEARTGMDSRADQYAWAAMLWEALAGWPPFAVASATSSFDAKVETTLRRPGQISPSLMAALCRALEPVARDRWPSMDALMRALERRPSQRRSLWMAAGVASVFVAAGGALASFQGKAEDASKAALTAVAVEEEASDAAAEPAAEASPEAPAEAQASASDRFRAAVDAYLGGKQEEAVTAFGEVAAQLVAEDQVAGALEQLDEAIEAASPADNGASLLQTLGKTFAEGGAHEGALRAYRQAWRAALDAGETAGPELLPLASAVLALDGAPTLERLELGVTMAKACSMPAAELAPHMIALAEALAAADRAPEALKTYRQTLALAHGDSSIGSDAYATWVLQTSSTARELGKGPVAKEVLARALEREYEPADEARLRFALARLLWDAKREAPAVKVAEKALALLGDAEEHAELRRQIQQWLDE